MKIFLNIITIIVQLNLIYGNCRNDYTFYKDGLGWYKLHKEPQIFHDAEDICQEEGTRMVFLNVLWSLETLPKILDPENIDLIHVNSFHTAHMKSRPNVWNRKGGPMKEDYENKYPFVCFAWKDCPSNVTTPPPTIPEAQPEVPEVSEVLEVPEFRSDYTYSEQAKGWLKFHSIPVNFNEARLQCHAEGAVLASPLNNGLATAMVTLAKNNSGNHFFTGIHAIFSKGDFTSIEGVPLSAIPIIKGRPEIDNFHNEESCIAMNLEGTLWDVPCGNIYQFICYKKQTKDMTTRNECGTTDADYRFESETGSCYKFHPEPRTWSRAYMTCAAEGGHLAIINSEEEARVLARIFSAVPLKSIRDIGGLYFAHIGFQDWGEHGTWLTIHGETLQKAGYEKWLKNEPNNLTHAGGVGEYCGSMTLGAELNDIYCDDPLAFICEKNPNVY